jgi:uncharacterized membrane protein YkvA (DUF1232 family)
MIEVCGGLGYADDAIIAALVLRSATQAAVNRLCRLNGE